MRPQLEYASTVWSPHTTIDITKLEAVLRRSARWATRDYQHTSSATQMIKDLNWCTLEQRRIDSRLTLMYKITYDLVAIPATDYLIPNTRQSRHNHQLAYRQIPTLKDYYKYTFFPRTIVHWNTLSFFIPVLPTVAQFSHSHLVNLVNTASGRSTIKLFICYQVTRLIPGLCIYCAFCDAISYRFPEFSTTFRYESRCIGTLIGVISIALDSMME